MSEATTQTLLASALNGDRSSLARLLSHVERDCSMETEIRAGLASTETESVVIGVTGPPGAGKSSLISALLPYTTKSFDRTAVLAVDPSSPFSGGALLGDRVRMQNHGLGDRVLI
ncbi:MAG: methylmalonyl Co-A mutase-associated GTPase MeaB, partial [Halieaceae bacterium]